jgi:hypothetical protein
MRKVKNTGFIVTYFVKSVLVQLSEDLYGLGFKHVANHLLKMVTCSSDKVALVA